MHFSKFPLDQITVVLQGNYSSETAQIIAFLHKIAPEMPIILSCWESNRSDVNIPEHQGVQTVFSTDPGSPVVPGFKVDNIRRQLVSTRAGLDRVRTPWVIKIRSDIAINPHRIPELVSLCKPTGVGPFVLIENKIVVTSLTTLDARHSDFYFHICDWVYLGRVNDVRSIFSASLPEDDFFTHFKGAAPAPQICSRYRSESYLIYHLVHKKLGANYPYSGFRSKQLSDLSHNVFKVNFVVVNSWNLGVRSSKYRRLYLWLRPDRYTAISCGSYLAKLNSGRAILEISLELVCRLASLAALPLFWLRGWIQTCRG